VAADPRLWLSRSWTTRARRPEEPEDAYVFVDHQTFRRRIDEDGFLEWFEVYGDLKGTPSLDPPPEQDVVLEIDLQGAQAVKAKYPDAVVIFVAPPSREEQERRIRARGDSDDDIRRRLERAEEEETLGRRFAAHVVVNDDVDRALGELRQIVERERAARG
jgi:guanylate kinase